jgi:hypothetical protein
VGSAIAGGEEASSAQGVRLALPRNITASANGAARAPPTPG